jgi:hypothetical protein
MLDVVRHSAIENVRPASDDVHVVVMIPLTHGSAAPGESVRHKRLMRHKPPTWAVFESWARPMRLMAAQGPPRFAVIGRGKVARNTTILRTLGCTFRLRRNLCW